jgi:hypothetical protein
MRSHSPHVTEDAPGLWMNGFGLKKQLLEDFASTTLTDFTIIVIKGYLPSINLMQVWLRVHY